MAGFTPVTCHHGRKWLRPDCRSQEDIIVSGGENISSLEVEKALLRIPAFMRLP